MQARNKRLGVRLGISVLVLVLFCAHSSGWLPLRLLSQIERYAYDARLLLTMPGTLDPRVVIIDIDERSLAAEGQFPWARDKVARLITNLFERYHIAVLGLDIVFAEPDRSAGVALLDRLGALPGMERQLAEIRRSLDTDAQLAEVLARHPVVTGYAFYPRQISSKGALPPPLLDVEAATATGIDFIRAGGFVGNLENLQRRAVGGGFFDNPVLDPDGIRRVPLLQQFDGQVYPSLSLAVARLALGSPGLSFDFEPPEARGSFNLEALRLGRLHVPVDGQAAVMVPYRGPQGSYPYISATDVLNGRADPALLRPGVIALLGVSAAGQYDLRVTPVGRAYNGVEIHANVIAAMLDGRIKQLTPYYVGLELIMLLVIALVLALVFPRLAPLAGAALVIGILAGLLALGFGYWQFASFILPLGVPMVFTLSLFLAQLLYGYFIESRRARGIARQFGEYVPPEIVAELAENPDAASMEGESREMTVLFSDVRGFTTFAEKLEPRELAQLMNQFLSLLTRVIQKQRGTIDKYMGDAIMAFWGAPLTNSQHARHALQAAMEMVHAVRELDAGFAARGWPLLHIGVGLSSGRMNVGNMGSEFRRAYTVMGDSVNLGSRLEGLTREYDVLIICSDATRAAVPDWAFRELDLVRVKGRTEPVAIFEPLGPESEIDPETLLEVSRLRQAQRAYRAQDWDAAEAGFLELSRSGQPCKIYQIYLERIRFLRQNPPGAAWDGAFTFTHK
jgi:adenylate cyclase